MSIQKLERTSIPIFAIGDSSTGKTSLISVYANDIFDENILTTIGIDFFIKYIKLPNGNKCTIKLWDTAGQEIYRSIALSNIKISLGIVLVYDISQLKTFQNIRNWIQLISDSVNIKEIPLLFIGNKIDLKNLREVNKEDGEKLANEYKGLFFETSAKEKINVKQAFDSLVDKIYYTYNDQFNIKKGNKNNNNKNKDLMSEFTIINLDSNIKNELNARHKC